MAGEVVVYSVGTVKAWAEAKGLDFGYKGFVNYWHNKKCSEFLGQLFLELEKYDSLGIKTGDLDRDLDILTRNEKISEKLYDAYRSVVIGASKNYGPKILAMITARLIGEGRASSVEEDAICYAAENLADLDLLWFYERRDSINANKTIFENNPAKMPLSCRKLISVGVFAEVDAGLTRGSKTRAVRTDMVPKFLELVTLAIESPLT